MSAFQPNNISEVQALVQEQPCLHAVGGRSKPALAAAGDGAALVDFTGLQGVLEYQPEEYTFTALAGTRLADIEAMLNEHGQYLPCDPPLVGRGATLGGMVAAGLSGSGRYRYGGVRDFVLAIQFVDGQGEVVRSGGKVVKNAAGFDLSKFMVGSLGQFGLLTELTFKVFPRPASYRTLRLSFPTLAEALAAMQQWAGVTLDLFSLDIAPQAQEQGAVLLARLGGPPETFPARQEKMQKLVGAGGMGEIEILEGAEEAALWRGLSEFDWLPQGQALVKVPLTPGRLLALDARLQESGAARHYAAGANLAWVGWPGTLAQLDRHLTGQGLSGLVVTSPNEPIDWRHSLLGVRVGETFAQRVKAALDPQGKFGG